MRHHCQNMFLRDAQTYLFLHPKRHLMPAALVSRFSDPRVSCHVMCVASGQQSQSGLTWAVKDLDVHWCGISANPALALGCTLVCSSMQSSIGGCTCVCDVTMVDAAQIVTGRRCMATVEPTATAAGHDFPKSNIAPCVTHSRALPAHECLTFASQPDSNQTTVQPNSTRRDETHCIRLRANIHATHATHHMFCPFA